MEPLKIPAYFYVGSPTRDRGMRFRGETQELSLQQKLIMLEYDNSFGWLLFSPNPIQVKDVPKFPADATKKMSRSMETRWLLRKIYEKNAPAFIETLEEYYDKRMEIINNELRRELNED